MSRTDGAHLDTLTIEAYAAHLVDADAEAAIEGHMICCESCRARIAAASDAGDLLGVESCRLESIWDAVVDAIDAPPRSLPTLVLVRLCSGWHRLRAFLARSVLPANRMIPVARRALVTVIALLAVPVMITVSGSTSLFAHRAFDTVDNSGESSGNRVPLIGGQPTAVQPVCAPAELTFAVDWSSVKPGEGTLWLANVSESTCAMPTVIDVQPLGFLAEPPEPGQAVELAAPDQPADSGPTSAQSAYGLYPPLRAESQLSWTHWCGARSSGTVRVAWSSGTADVTGSVPESPACPPGADRPTLSASKLRPVPMITSGLQPL